MLLAQASGLGEAGTGVDHAVDDAQRQRLIGEQHLAADRHAAHRLRAEAADRALRARPAGHDADRIFGEAELDMPLGDAEVGRGGELEPAAQRMAGQHGDRRLAQARQPVEDAMAEPHPFHLEVGGAQLPTTPRRRRRRKNLCLRR